MIRNHYLTQINKMIVEAGRFKEADFSVTFRPEEVQDENEKAAYVLEVAYCYEPSYKFVARMGLSDEVTVGDVVVSITASPGNIFTKERYADIKIASLNDNIKNWLNRLHNELSSIPIQRQLEEQHLEIESILQQLDNIPKEYLSRQEAEALRARLDTLEEALTRNLQETVTDTEELEAKVSAITEDMSVLKDNLSVLSKKGWARALITRSFEWAKDPANRKMVKSGVEVARDLLGSGEKPPGM